MNHILTGLAASLMRGQMSEAFTIVKSEAGLGYVSVVNIARALVVSLYSVWLVTGAAILGAFVFMFSILNLSGVSPKTLYLTMTILGGLVFAVALVVLSVLLSDSFWIKIAKVDEVVSEVVESAGPNAASAQPT